MRKNERFAMSVAGVLCYQMARRQILKESTPSTIEKWVAGANPNVYDVTAYQAWRRRELEAQFERYFDPSIFKDKDVLDFGCGGGDLSVLSAQHQPRSVLGMEVSAEQHEIATRCLRIPVNVISHSG